MKAISTIRKMSFVSGIARPALTAALLAVPAVGHAQATTPEAAPAINAQQAAATTNPAVVQDAPQQVVQSAAASDTIGDIIVTALKGGVSVQRAPVTVNIVSGDTIANKGVVSVEQLTAAVPGVRINQAPQGAINPVVRGLGSSPSNQSFEQTVGLFVDGIFAGHPRDYSAALFDLDRVELLKGTQSAVVGKNTSVGALTLVTRKPSFELGGEASYLHEFELGSDIATAAVNLPLSETVAVRVAGLFSNEGGWVKPVLTGAADTPGVKRRAVRATLRFRPNDALDWTVSGQYTDFRQTGQYFKVGADTLGNARTDAILGGDTNFSIVRYQTRNTPRAGFSFGGLTGIGSRNEAARFNSTINYDLGSVLLTSVTGYSQYKDANIIDGSSLINSPVTRAGYETDNAFSQELRVATNAASPLSLIAGAYYYHDVWTFEDLFDFNAAQLVAPPLGGSFRSGYHQTTKTVSVFGQLRYKITDALQVSGSLRYENFQKEGDYNGRVVLRPGGLTAAVYGPYAPFSLSNGRDYVTYSGQAQYFFTPRINAYASYSTGTKGFGYVSTPTSPGGVVTPPFFNTERSYTVEAGIKAGFGPRSNINIAFFDTRLKDYQIGVNLGTNFLIRNDQVRSTGVEGNLNLGLLDGLTAMVTATYADVRKTGTLPANSIPGLPYSPKWSGLASLSYETPIGGELRFKSNATAEFRSKQQLSDVATFVIPSVPGRVRTDVRLAVEHQPSKVELALVGRNIFNVYALSYGFSQFGATGAAQVAEEQPRTIALQVSVRF